MKKGTRVNTKMCPVLGIKLIENSINKLSLKPKAATHFHKKRTMGAVEEFEKKYWSYVVYKTWF